MPEEKEQSNHVALVHGYNPGPNGPRPAGSIQIGGWFTDEDSKRLENETHPQWEKRMARKFESEAEAVYTVLSNNLPGGTLHQLLIKFLQGKLNLYVVQDIPTTTIRDIAELARDYVWGEPLRWEGYLDSKKPGVLPLPADCVRWSALCQAVEKRYGPPPVEKETHA